MLFVYLMQTGECIFLPHIHKTWEGGFSPALFICRRHFNTIPLPSIMGAPGGRGGDCAATVAPVYGVEVPQRL